MRRMFSKTLWLTAMIGGVIGLLIFEVCALALPDSPFLSRIIGIALFTLVLVILVARANRQQRKKQSG